VGEGGAAVREAHLDDRFDTLADKQVAEEVAVAFGQRNSLEVPLVRPGSRRPILHELAANVADPVAAILGFTALVCGRDSAGNKSCSW
jgi:hypothetical protein